MFRAVVATAVVVAPALAVAEPAAEPATAAPPAGAAPPTVSSHRPSTDLPSPGSEQPPPPAAPGMRSYRAATIGLDFAMVSAFVYALDHDKDRMLELSIGTYAFGAPLIHVVKGRNVSALASLGMRVGFPVLGAMLGERLHATPKCVDEGCDEGPHAEVVLGVVLGVGAAMVIDSVYLARGDKPTTTPERTWSPTVRASQGGFALGAAGTF